MMGTPTRKSIFALRYTTGAAKTSALYEANTGSQAQISVRIPIILTKKWAEYAHSPSHPPLALTETRTEPPLRRAVRTRPASPEPGEGFLPFDGARRTGSSLRTARDTGLTLPAKRQPDRICRGVKDARTASAMIFCMLNTIYSKRLFLRQNVTIIAALGPLIAVRVRARIGAGRNRWTHHASEGARASCARSRTQARNGSVAPACTNTPAVSYGR